MKTATAPKFMDDVVDEMGDGNGGTEYGASMDETSDDEGTDDEQKEDRIMAFKTLAKALGLSSVDPSKGADALASFIAACS
jgi:hypothetical protein